MKNPLSRIRLVLIAFFCLTVSVPSFGQQKERSYELLPAPDLWYNDVDGIRAGVRLLGQVPGTFEDGPHRLDMGVWLGTWFPDVPISYYLSFTEPIAGISDFGSEGNIQLVTSFRTGFHNHGLTFNKRWQTGFDERNYKELAVSLRAEGRSRMEYLAYPQLWSEGWLYLVRADFTLQNESGLGRYLINTSNTVNLLGNHDSFISSQLEFQQHFRLGENFEVRGRLFAAAASNTTDRQYLFARSFRQARQWMDSGLIRAKGTIPTAWFDDGFIQVAGGANLRGYLAQDFELLNNNAAPLLTSVGSFNLELDYPNPIDRAIKKIPVIGGIINLRSYLFFDSGTSLGITDFEESRVISDAGLGFMFSLNIPDYLGKPRGIMIRYDLPLWLSNPAIDENNFEFRNIVGVGAVISL